MADDSLTGQYSVVASFLTPYVPSWLSGDTINGLRIASYQFYENLYWNDAGGFKMTLRGDEEFPVYIPSARRIINTFNRYVGRDLSFRVEGQTTEQVTAAQDAFDILFKREKFFSLFRSNKKMGLIRGDWIIGLFADPLKPEGRRISIRGIHPSRYFPIVNPRNSEELWGQSLIESVHIGDKDYINFQRWLKPIHPDHPQTGSMDAPIAYENATYEQENWNDPTKRKTFAAETDIPLDVLPGIFTLPLYHFGNDQQQGNLYGTSELKGLERIFLAINQTATDEDVAIAMAGLGLYVSDATPVDADGNVTDWVLGPKRVVEIPRGGEFKRVSGVASIEASQGHMDWMQKQAESVVGISDVALGQVDVSVAESGVALALRMGPLLDASAERDGEIEDVLIQFFHDLKQWFLIYEKINMGDDVTGATIMPVWGDKLPTDRKGQLDRLAQLHTDGVISLEFYWTELNKLGYDIDINEMRRQIEEDGALADPTGARLAAEADAPIDLSLTNA
jgi:hypothetical protein